MTNLRLGFLAFLIGCVLAFVGLALLPIGDQTAPVQLHTSRGGPVSVEATTSTVSPTTTAPVVIKAVSEGPSKRVQVPSRSESTTTTSEVPPPLTPEQEERIPSKNEEITEDDDEFIPEDYDLPSKTSTTVIDPF